MAIECTKNFKDNFKLAMATVELGDVYYNLNLNKDALKMYFEAVVHLKKDSKTNINLSRVFARIEDMKKKMSNVDFLEIEQEYKNE